MSIHVGLRRTQAAPPMPRRGEHDRDEREPLPVRTPHKHPHTHTVELLRTEADARHLSAFALAARIHSHRIG